MQDPLLRRARKKRRSFTLPIYETEATQSKHVDTGVQTYESYRAADDDDGNGFLSDCVMSGVEEIAQFGETYFGRTATGYLSRYARGDRSINTV